MAEQWPDEYQEGMQKGKRRILALEHIRKDSLTHERYTECKSRRIKLVEYSIDAG